MQVRGKLLPIEIKEASRFVRSKWYWPRVVLRSWYGLMLLLVLAWGTIVKIVSGDREHWLGLSLVWVAVAGILVWVISSTRRSRDRAIKALNQGLPDWLVFGSDGVQGTSTDGVTSSRPWTTLSGWREGASLLALSLSGKQGFVFVPLTDLLSEQRVELRKILREHLGESQNQHL